MSLLKTILERSNLSIYAQVVAPINGLLIEEEKTNMFSVGAFMEVFSWVLVLGNCLYFEVCLYFNLSMQIHLLGGRPMKANF
jgi:hypothetical protein